MPINVTPADEFTAPVQSVADGDAVNQANELLGIQDLANRTEYLRNRSKTLNSTYPLDLLHGHNDEDNGTVRWETAGNTSRHGWQQTDVTDGGRVVVPLPYLPGATLTDVTVYLIGALLHGGLPATPPQIEILSKDLTAAFPLTSDSGPHVDPSGSVGAYEVLHTIDAGGALSINLGDPNRTYVLAIEGETGANSLTGLIISAAQLTLDWT